MRVRLVNLAAKASLATFLVGCALWARSGYASDVVWWSLGGGTEYHVRSDWGRVVLTVYQSTSGARAGAGAGSRDEGGWHGASSGRAVRRWSFYEIVDYTAGRVDEGADVGPALVSRKNAVAAGATYHRWITYYPLPLTLTLLPTLPWLRRRLRARRARRRSAIGRCATCGYDLRESPARCPECGATPIAQRQPVGGVAAGAVD